MRALAGVLAAAAIFAAPAAAADFGLRTYDVRVAGGTMKLEFHGDKGTGCERRGLCGVSGTVTSAVKQREGGFGFLTTGSGMVFGSISVFVSGIARATVHTEGAPDCVDESARTIDTYSLAAIPGHPAVVGLGSALFADLSGVSFGGSAGDDVFGTRCAGPTADDVVSAMPRAFVRRSVLGGRRSFTVRLSPIRVFAAGGFAGTVTSDLRLRFTRGPCKGRRNVRYCRAFDDAATNSA
jgi:hypothetical protein